MFVYNLKIKKPSVFQIVFVCAILIAIVFFIIASYKIIKASNIFKTNDDLHSSDVYEITNANYTNILKTVHDNVHSYIGQTVHLTGYVYRVPDIGTNQFILARDMIVNSDKQTLVVGFLAQYDDAKKFNEKTWVDITGTIQKGDYHGEIPVIMINSIKQIKKPSDEFVYPPDSDFIPTSALIN